MVKLNLDDRILILGESKSGKTYLGDIMLQAYKRIVVITSDPTEFKWAKNRIVTIDPGEVNGAIQKALEMGRVVIAIDDADLYFTKYISDENVRYLLIAGRHRKVGWAFMGRRTQDLPTLVFKQANKVFAFQTDLDLDRETYRKNYGEQFEQLVNGLNRDAHQFVFFDRDSRQMRVMTA